MTLGGTTTFYKLGDLSGLNGMTTFYEPNILETCPAG
jgi:hypothetical protein